MSKIMNKKVTRRYRRQLLTTVSAAALLIAAYSKEQAIAAGDDVSRPPVWIELGWHFERMQGLGDAFAPPFQSAIVDNGFASPSVAENALGYSYGGEGKLTFQPDGSDWLFSASIRYGRSHSRKKTHKEEFLPPYKFTLGSQSTYFTPQTPSAVDTRASNNETHAIVDFQAGRDFGLGMFGRGSTSTLGLGVRFAQFNSSSNSDIAALPHINVHLVDLGQFHNVPLKYSHDYLASAHGDRSFHGLGPSISWNGSAPVLGDAENGELSFDFGLNAALLFGRQRTNIQHQTTGDYYKKYPYHTHYKNAPPPLQRERSVTVPNAGGFAGASYRIEDFKVSLGYRADFFFGAIDGGWDTRRSTTRGFFGPFASVSVGMGG